MKYDEARTCLTKQRLLELRKERNLSFAELSKVLAEQEVYISHTNLKNYEILNPEHPLYGRTSSMSIEYIVVFADFYDESYTAVYLAVGGSVVFDERTADSEREQISGFVDYTISGVPDDVPSLTAAELYNNSAQYDQTEIVVKGEILEVVSYSDMTGYYLFGVSGNGLVCWVYTTQEYDVGDTVEFYGTVYSGSNVEISDCVVVE